MKRIKCVCAICLVALMALLCFCTVNLKAAWYYHISISENIEIPVDVKVMPWVGVEELPNDIMGEDHEKLIETILSGTYTDANGNVTEIGLNNPNSYINQEIANRTQGSSWFTSDTLGSMDFWESSDIAKYFDTETTGLEFVIWFPEDQPNVHYLFTTSVDLGESNNPNFPIGEDIYPIYRTKLEQNAEGEWEATETKTGYADSAYYDNPITGSWLVKYPSFDPTTWEEGKLGTSTENAVYSYVGQEVTCYNDTATDATYYKLTVSANANVTVSSQNTSAQLTVYNSAGTQVATRGGAHGTNSVTFRGQNGQTYYIKVSGGESITFTIS